MGVIARQSVQGTVVTYLGVLVGFFTTFFVLTRFLTTEEIGLVRVLIDAATLFVGLAGLGTNSSVVRFFPSFKGGREKRFFRMALLLPLLGFGLFSLVYILCQHPLGQWFGEKSPLFVHYYYAVLPIAFFMLYQGVFEVISNVRMKIVVPRTVRELITRLLLLVVYLLYAFRVLSVDGFVLTICLSYAIVACINAGYFLYIEHRRPSVDNGEPIEPALWRQMGSYTFFLVVSSLAGVLSPLLSSFFITAKMGLDYTGIFAIATYMAVMVSIPYRSLTAIAAPELAAAVRSNDRASASHLMQQVAGNLLLIGGFILLVIWINIDLIFHILPNGATFATARYVVLLLGVSQLLVAVFQMGLTCLNFSNYYGFSLLWSLLLTAVGILLNNYLIPLYGMNGAAMANLLGNAIYYICVIGTILLLVRVQPLSKSHIKTLVLIITIFILNYLLCRYLPLGVWSGSILRSVLLLGGGMTVAYMGNLSPEMNALLRSFFVQRH